MNRKMLNMGARRSAGFTLIEMMVVVVIIGILSTIAYPSYRNYVMQTRRADAQVALMELAQFMERHYTRHGGYLEGGHTGDGPTLPFSVSPNDGGTAMYQLSLDEVSRQGYSLQAVPQNMMSADSCGTFTLDHLGRKGSEGPVAECWKR